MTVAEFAMHRGCSDSYIRRMRRLGKLVMAADGKRIVVTSSDALLDDITDPVRGGDRTPGAAARGEVPLARARLAELELGEESKELTRTKGVERAVFTLVRQALNSMLNMSGRLRAKLAAESDPRAVEALLDAEVRRIAETMQEEARQLLASELRDSLADADEVGA